ncbi:hypothetical protein AS181_02320 [Gordonia sp. SGD-V-85]|nr:hypothetical protein AS181_02320 [Gordonia sp. SGD-V-85]OCW86831.1 hypothetical protein A8M60_19780 [Nocardia farcinica]
MRNTPLEWMTAEAFGPISRTLVRDIGVRNVRFGFGVCSVLKVAGQRDRPVRGRGVDRRE